LVQKLSGSYEPQFLNKKGSSARKNFFLCRGCGGFEKGLFWCGVRFFVFFVGVEISVVGFVCGTFG
jgi:hypothetical protein